LKYKPDENLQHAQLAIENGVVVGKIGQAKYDRLQWAKALKTAHCKRTGSEKNPTTAREGWGRQNDWNQFTDTT